MSAVIAGLLSAAATISAARGARSVEWNRTDRLGRLERTAAGRRLARSLSRAGIGIGPAGFVGAVAAGALVLGGAAGALLRSTLAAAIVAGAAVWAAYARIASADRRYVDRLAAQMPIVAQQLSGAIGAGLSLRQAIVRVGADAPEPVATELRRLATELALGARIDDALDTFAERVPTPGVRMVVTAILIQRTVGGNLAAALAQLSRRLEERTRLEREARSATAQARMSAWLVAGLPLGGGLIVEMAAPGTLAQTLGRGPGRALLILAIALELLGVVLVRKLLEQDRLG